MTFLFYNREKESLMKKTVAYLRVSTADQNTEKNKSEILLFTNNRKFGHVEFIEETVSGKKSWKERKLKGLVDDLGEGDRLIVPELSRLGRSMLEIMEILAVAKERGIHIYDIKGNWELNGSIQSKVMAMVFSIAAEIERDLISSRTKEALRARKAAGVQLGRPKGPGKSKLDKYKEEIIALLKNGSTKTYLAKKYGTSLPNFYNWMKKNEINVKAEL
jgi:DNA invertase Pin-like site-specific DNA recombinase